MTNAAGATGWRELPEFAAVDIDRSFVLSWHVETETLYVDADLFLTPDHPAYEEPRPAEKVCIRPAVIEFPICESLRLDGETSGGGIADVAARIGHGRIDDLQRFADGHYEIRGDFGTVTVDAERPILRLKRP